VRTERPTASVYRMRGVRPGRPWRGSTAECCSWGYILLLEWSPKRSRCYRCCTKEIEVRGEFLTRRGFPERRGFDLAHPPVYMVGISGLRVGPSHPYSHPGPPCMNLKAPSSYGQLLRPPPANHHLEWIFLDMHGEQTLQLRAPEPPPAIGGLLVMASSSPISRHPRTNLGRCGSKSSSPGGGKVVFIRRLIKWVAGEKS